MEFKILALQLNKENQYTKTLKVGVLYRFTEEFEFIYDPKAKNKGKRAHDYLIEIRNRMTYPKGLYDLHDHKSINHVNITAILGKNGAGKSTLLELLYLLLYSLSERKEFLQDRSNNSRFIEKKHLADYYEQQNKKIDEILEVSQMELFYKLDDEFCLISNSGKQINFYVLRSGKWEIEEFKRNKFFYTICVNYSLHGLNSAGEYFWLNGLFHKNDGYKTPLVITPWRDQGNIDINVELHLAQTRILANVIGESFESENIIDDKAIAELEFKLMPDNVGKIDFFTLAFIYRNTMKITKVDLIDLFENLITTYDKAVKPDLEEVLTYLREDLRKENSEKNENRLLLSQFAFDNLDSVDNKLIRCLLAKYIVSKVVKICMKYSDFRKFTSSWSYEENNVANILLINSTSALIKKLKKDQTHVTLKLKQAINAFLFDYMDKAKWTIDRNPANLDRAIFKTVLSFSDFRWIIRDAYSKSKQKKKVVSNFIPTGFFWPTVMIASDNGNFPFGHLSSGEQQMVHAIHSIIYHILNLDSLDESKQPYNAVNLVLDEIELYYHPEYQRLFVKKLLESLGRLKLKSVSGINIIFSTHSPFILSDIPHRNVLKLRDGVAAPFNDEAKTFGSNIHEMLTDSFFLDQNLIGAFAESKIQDCIKDLRLLELGGKKTLLEQSSQNKENTAHISRINEDINKLTGKKKGFDYKEAYNAEIRSQKLLKTISIIGEPVVKYKLLEMYDESMMIEDGVKAKARRDIQEIMERTGITKEDF